MIVVYKMCVECWIERECDITNVEANHTWKGVCCSQMRALSATFNKNMQEEQRIKRKTS